MSQIVLTADTLSTATAGAFEYDGRVAYVTPQGTQRGVVLGAQFFRLNSDYAGTTATTAQGIFGIGTSGVGVGVTLSSSTIYAFESVYVLSKTATATSHNISVSFGGTATINNILYVVLAGGLNQLALPVLNDGLQYSSINTTSASNIAPSITTTNRIQTVRYTGTVSIGTGGTFIPQYTTSAAVGPYSTTAGSYFLIYPLSISGSNTSVGAWA